MHFCIDIKEKRNGMNKKWEWRLDFPIKKAFLISFLVKRKNPLLFLASLIRFLSCSQFIVGRKSKVLFFAKYLSPLFLLFPVGSKAVKLTQPQKKRPVKEFRSEEEWSVRLKKILPSKPTNYKNGFSTNHLGWFLQNCHKRHLYFILYRIPSPFLCFFFHPLKKKNLPKSNFFFIAWKKIMDFSSL